MLAVAKRYPTFEITNDDEADAVGLLALGLDQLGHPLAPVPARNRHALEITAWPAPPTIITLAPAASRRTTDMKDKSL
jgi:hypothetical protein